MSIRLSPRRGEIWLVDLAPTVGDEIKKVRPAVVVGSDALGVLRVKLVAPITSWNHTFSGKLWLVPLQPDGVNGLSGDSVVDVLQLRGVAFERFTKKLGKVSAAQLEEIAAAVAIAVEYQ